MDQPPDSFFRLNRVTRREVILMVASIAAGVLLVVVGLAWIGRDAHNGRAELERAIADLSAIPAPDGSILEGRGARACVRDDIDGDTEPTASADYRWEEGAHHRRRRGPL